MDKDKYTQLYHRYMVYVIIAFVTYLILFKLLPALLPFIVAAILAIVIDPAVEFLEKKLKIPRGLAVAVTMLSIFGFILFLIAIATTQIISELQRLLGILPAYFNSASKDLNTMILNIQDLYAGLPKNVTDIIQSNIGNVVNTLYGIAKASINYTINLFSNIPHMFMISMITLIATFFMSKDKNIIVPFLLKQIPKKWAANTHNIKTDLFKTLFGFLRAELTIILLTFIECSIGLLIIGFDYAFLMGLIVSVVDALPIIGSGSVLIPWALIVIFIYKNVKVGIYLIILYAIIIILRQLMEPHIVGSSIGLHPLVTLLSMYLGLKFMGFIGLFMGPAIVILVKTMQKAGLIPSFKT
ncbi:sporulation integral membrane protein YtvI [Caldanaerobius polysaccharolyticus]|uniref:sporulation integral membrane protein YtvI n=1 Tax=Caldanaerobius polysaccharolyticus TaxID=44256 RepID=UPI00047A78CB|nr:sporulation integral membrane protein YtvI [Caldanaerobius polysaccharolyticus]